MRLVVAALLAAAIGNQYRQPIVVKQNGTATSNYLADTIDCRGGVTCVHDGGGTVIITIDAGIDAGVWTVTATAPLASSGGTAPDISISGQVAQTNGGTGTGTLTCSAGQSLTSNGSAYSCTSTITESDLVCAGTCVADGEIAGLSGSKVSGAVPTASALASDPTDCSAGQYATAINTAGALTCAQVSTSQLSGTVTDGQLASNYSGVGACGANQWASTLNDNAAPTCTQPAFSNISGTVTDGQLANNYSGVGACGANTWASTLNDNGAPTCTQPAFTNISGTITDGQLANNYSGVGACGANTWASTLNDNASPTCTQPSFSNLSGTATDSQLASNYSGVGACGANTWASTLNDNASPTCTQPAFSNLSGSVASTQLPAVTAANLGAVKGTGASLTCSGTDKMNGFTAAGAINCTADQTGGAGSTNAVKGEIDFGVGGDTYVTKFVSASWVTASSTIVCSITAEPTSTRTAEVDDAIVEGIRVGAFALDAGIGFTVGASVTMGTGNGAYAFTCLGM